MIPPDVPHQPEGRRSALGLWLQMFLQPLWLIPNFVLAFMGAESGIREGMDDNMTARILGTRRIRLERRGTPQEWEQWLDERLVERGAQLSRLKRNHAFHKGGLEMVIQRRYYRGIGPRGAAVVAHRRGWVVDWAKSPKPYAQLTLRFDGPFGQLQAYFKQLLQQRFPGAPT
jgi:hypothetical protein